MTFCKQTRSQAVQWFRPDTEAEWHALRRGDITATAAASLFGVSPYMTPFDLFHRLAGNVVVEIEESERMRWGKRLQRAIAEGICEDKGWRIVEDHPYLYARSVRVPGMGASPDYIVEDIARPELGRGCLEIKNVDRFVGMDDWSDEEAPPHIELQLQHQMAVTGFAWGAVGGLIGGNSAMVFPRMADAEVIAELRAAVADMQARVRANDPPPPDYLADYDTIRALYRTATVGKSVNLDLPEPGDDVDKLTSLIAAKYNADIAFKIAEDDKKTAHAKLLDFLKDTETVFGGGWKVSATTTHREASTVNYPATSFRNLRVSKPKPKKGKS